MRNSPIMKTKKKLTAEDYIKMADAYFNTSKVLIKHIDEINMNPIPLYYLLSHSLELYLKGYIYKNNDSEAQNTNTHNLFALYQLCDGLELSDNEIAHIAIFNHYNNKRGRLSYFLRYPGLEEAALPNLNVATTLLDNIALAINKLNK